MTKVAQGAQKSKIHFGSSELSVKGLKAAGQKAMKVSEIFYY